MEQLDIFDFLYENFKINKPIRLIEFFAGYGSQNFALTYLQSEIDNFKFEHHKICEWNIHSMQAYNDFHIRDYKDYSSHLKVEEIIDFIEKKGCSSNWNEPMKRKQIEKLGEQKLRKIYNNIKATNNLVDISKVNGEDLEISNTNKYTYLLTYSFPCQDLSLAGLRAGMKEGTNTRSSLLWEVGRILQELDYQERPMILLMENVPQVHSDMALFDKWIKQLENLGYKSYWKDLNAKDYGIPQNRVRTFMISVKGDYNYDFPKSMELKLRLRDMLENEVDEKYFLSDKMINGMLNTNYESYKLENKLLDVNGVANTIIARFEGSPQVVCENKKNLKQQYCNELLKKSIVKEWDVVTHSYSNDRLNHNSGKRIYKDNISPTLTTRPDTLGVVVKGNYSKSGHNATRIVDINGLAPTVMENHGSVTAVLLGGVGEKKSNKGKQFYFQDRIYSDDLSVAITTCANPYYSVSSDLRIRKLTPRECLRLMGVKDNDINKISYMSNSILYHLAGDSIVVNVIMEILRVMI